LGRKERRFCHDEFRATEGKRWGGKGHQKLSLHGGKKGGEIVYTTPDCWGGEKEKFTFSTSRGESRYSALGSREKEKKRASILYRSNQAR